MEGLKYSGWPRSDGYRISVWANEDITFAGGRTRTFHFFQGSITLEGVSLPFSSNTPPGGLKLLVVPAGLGVTCDTLEQLTPPRLVSASVKGSALTLTFDRDLDSGSKPANSAFAVTVDGTARALASNGVDVSGNTVTLTLSSAVTPGDPVTVAYIKPSTTPLQDNILQRALASFPALAVSNHTEVKLVSNTEQIGTTLSSLSLDRAQAFTTGSGTGGYKLTRVDLVMRLASGTAPDKSVSIHADSAGQPGSILGTLTNPSSLPSTAGEVQFTSPGGIDLAADTTYWVVIDSSTSATNAEYGMTSQDAEDANAASGWAIADSASSRTNPDGSSWDSSPTTVLRMALYGFAFAKPAFASAAVDGTALTLTFSENLDTGSKPADSAFAVTVDGSTRSLTSGGVAISGSTVTLTLASAVTIGQTVTVSYTKPATDPLQHAGRVVDSFSNQAVANNTSVTMVSNTGQTPYAAHSGFGNDYGQAFTTGSGTDGYSLKSVSILMAYTGSTLPDYSVKVHSDAGGQPGGSLGTLTNPSSLPSALGEVQFTSPGGIDLTADTTYWVTVDFSTSTAGGSIGRTDERGEDADAASGWSIADSVIFQNAGWRLSDNRWSSLARPVRVAVHGYAKATPALESAEVNGTTMALTFSEKLDPGSEPAVSAFSVTAGGSAQTPTDVDISGNTVTLTLGTAATSGQTVTVSYTRPSTNPLQHAGRVVASFSNQSVANNTIDPNSPKNLRVETDNHSGAYVTWSAPDSVGAGRTLSTYVVEWKTGTSTAMTQTVAPASDGNHKHRITGLTDGSEYTVRVAARTTGTSPATQDAWSAAAPPVTAWSEPTQLWFTEQSPRIIGRTLFVQVDTNKAWGTIVCRAVINGVPSSPFGCPRGSQVQHTSPTAISGFAQVRATMAIGSETWSTHTAFGHADAPSSFLARASGGAAASDGDPSTNEGRIVVAWDAASSTVFIGTHEDYRVIYSSSDAGVSSTGISTDTTAREHTITGLADGTYSVLVIARAVNTEDHDGNPVTPPQQVRRGGFESEVFSIVVDADNTAVPGGPTGGSVTPGIGSLTVEWEPPYVDDGSPVHAYAYQVRHRLSGTTTWTESAKLYPRQTLRICNPETCVNPRTYEIGDLTGGSSYDVEVRAHNANGAGSWVAIGATHTPKSPIWMATLTAGPSGQSGNGCRTGSATQCSTALSENSFTVGTTTYQVNILAAGVDSGTSMGFVELELDQEIPTTWTLHVGTNELDVSTATRSNGNKNARWHPVNWGIGNGDVLTVGLKEQ